MTDSPPNSAPDPTPPEDCPACGSTLTTIQAPFRGPSKQLDNFNEVEAALRDLGVVSDSLGKADESETINTDVDGPYIVDAIVCSEIECSDCEFSERTWHEVSDLADELRSELLGNDETDGLDSTALLGEFQ